MERAINVIPQKKNLYTDSCGFSRILNVYRNNLAKLRLKPTNNSVFFLSVFTKDACKHRQKEHSV